MLILLLGGCLLLQEQPPACPETCEGNFACDETLGCRTSCDRDRDCADGYYCNHHGGPVGECEVQCQEGDCPGGFACWGNDECEDYCIDDGDCVSGYFCCRYGDSCPESRVGDCLADD